MGDLRWWCRGVNNLSMITVEQATSFLALIAYLKSAPVGVTVSTWCLLSFTVAVKNINVYSGNFAVRFFMVAFITCVRAFLRSYRSSNRLFSHNYYTKLLYY